MNLSYKPLDAIFDQRHMKIDEKAQAIVRQAHVAQQ